MLETVEISTTRESCTVGDDIYSLNSAAPGGGRESGNSTRRAELREKKDDKKKLLGENVAEKTPSREKLQGLEISHVRGEA